MKRISLNANDEAILSVDMVEPKEWIEHFITARTTAIINQIAQSEPWSKLLQSAIHASINPEDRQAVVLHGLQRGVLETARQKQDAVEAEHKTGVKVEDPKKPSPERVEREMIKRQLALVNASSIEQMNERIMRGTHEGMRLLKTRLTREWTDEEKVRAEELDRIEATLENLRKTGALIRADVVSGKITDVDQITNDRRWPQ